MRDLKLASLVVGLIVLSASPVTTHAADDRDAERPNILWVTTEDTGPHLGCYGHPDAVTPHLDRLAARGLRYRNAWSNAPVCAPARTAIISGVYPTSTGSEHMRSLVEMPPFMRMYPQFLRERGYYCTNNSKEDYNLEKPGKVWDESSNKAHWKGRKSGQPFFAVFNFTITHEGQIHRRPHTPKHDPARVRIPAYHPDTPEVRLDWAQYHDNITTMDAQVGPLLEELKAAGLADETIVFFYGDHGPGMPRSKRWPYNSGLNVPLIVHVPEKFKHLAPREYAAGTATDRLVSFVDLAPALLSLVGLRPPAWMQGHAFMGRFEAPPQPYLHGFRGRMDERYDLVRSARDERYVYIRNYMPHIVYGQYLTTMFKTPTTLVWKQLHDEGKLEPPQTYFWKKKPAEELYDLQTDPDEVNNLAGSPEHRSILEELRRAQREQVLRVRDVGLLSEAEMHSRADGMSIYEMGHDPERYPLERVLEMAELASSLKPDSLPRLRDGLGDADAAVRYWAAMGILIRGDGALRSTRVAIRRALQDESPSVRIVTARALGRFGDDADLRRALPVLMELAPPDKNGAYVSMLALDAIVALDDRAASLADALSAMPTKDPNAAKRANDYVQRLVKIVLERN